MDIVLSNEAQPDFMLHAPCSILTGCFVLNLAPAVFSPLCVNNSDVRCYTNLLSPMAFLLTALFLAVSVSAWGITEAPSAITPAPEEACSLTNSIPGCGVSRFPLWELYASC
jgi:hypothetical protein